MVEEFGEYLEELAKDYLTIVEGHNLVDIEAPRSSKRSTRHVAGVKGKVIMIVSCRERPGGAEDWKKDVEQLKRARIGREFRDLEVHYSVAYANYPEEIVKDDMRDFFKVRGVRVLFLEEMEEAVLMSSEG